MSEQRERSNNLPLDGGSGQIPNGSFGCAMAAYRIQLLPGVCYSRSLFDKNMTCCLCVVNIKQGEQSSPLDSELTSSMGIKATTAPDPAIGTWKLNVARSSFALSPAPKGRVMKIEACEDGLKVSADIIDADGKQVHSEVVHKFDGKDYPLNGSPLADSISTTRINARRGVSVLKRLGNVVLAAKSVISWDGKTLTVVRTGMDAQGRIVDEVLVYERQ